MTCLKNCGVRLQTKPKKRKNDWNQNLTMYWIEDIVAFHKAKRKFVSLKGYAIGRCRPIPNMRIQGLWLWNIGWLTSIILKNVERAFFEHAAKLLMSCHPPATKITHTVGISGLVIITLSPSVYINKVSPMRNFALSTTLRGILTITGGFLPDLAALIVPVQQ